MKNKGSIQNEEIILLIGYKKIQYGANMETAVPFYQPLFGSQIITSLEGIDNYVLIDAEKYKKLEYKLDTIENIKEKAEEVKGIIFNSMLDQEVLNKYSMKVKSKVKRL